MTKFITGENRYEIRFFCMEQAVEQYNEVRLIELFVHALQLKYFGFKTDFVENGLPAYYLEDLLSLKIFYSVRNGTLSIINEIFR